MDSAATPTAPVPERRIVRCPVCGHRMGERANGKIVGGGIRLKPGRRYQCDRCGQWTILNALPFPEKNDGDSDD